LPFLEQGLVYSKKDVDTGELGALQAACYQEEIVENKNFFLIVNKSSNNWDCASSEYSSQVLPITQRISQAVILPLRFLASKFILVGSRRLPRRNCRK
jgi:hypothetical protein